MAVTAPDQLITMLNDLIKLDYDAAAAYQAAIDRLSNEAYKERLREFKMHHMRHTTDLGRLVRGLGGMPAHEGDAREILTKGKVVIGGLMGDKGVLQAMKSNEETTNRKYEQALATEGLSTQLRDVLEQNLADERLHLAWVTEHIGKA